MSLPYEKIPRTKEISLCPCKSKKSYEDCCMLYHYGRSNAPTAEALMRSRYSAYFFRLIDYLVDTHHPETRDKDLKQQLESDIYEANWSFLTIVNTSKGDTKDKTGKVAFIAEYFIGPERHEMHEHSRFKKFKGKWKYLDDKG